MKVAVLVYSEKKDASSFDLVATQVADALKERGHDVSILVFHGDVRVILDGLDKAKPDLVFNLAEMFGTDMLGDVGLVGLLDLTGLPYTGGGPAEFAIARDKALAKKVLSFDGVRSPGFALFSQDDDLEMAGRLRMPLFVKPLRHDASIGIDQRSLVRDLSELMKKVAKIHRDLGDAALVEEFIDGRELLVGVLGNRNARALPPIEVDFSGMPPGTARVLDARAKWDVRSPEYKGTKCAVATLPEELRARIEQIAIFACRSLRVCDYGRVDLRMNESGEIHVIEVNPSCYLEKSSEFAVAAAADGIDFPSLVERIAELALERHRQRSPRLKKK